LEDRYALSNKKIREEYVDVDGVDTHFLLTGEGPPVILLHCLWAPSAWVAWRHNIPALGKHFRTYAVDMVGFGLSGKPKLSYSLSCFADFLDRFVTIQRIQQASLIGWSYGGNIAIKFALRFPGKVNKLVLVDAVLCRNLRLRHRMALGRVSLPIIGDFLIKRMLRRDNLRKTYSNFFYNKRYVTDELIDETHSFLKSPKAQETFLVTARSIGTFSGFRKDSKQFDMLQRINAPTLIMTATHSHRPVADAEIARKKIKNSKIVVFQNCAHAIQIERASEFNTIVCDFLEA